MIEEVKSTMYVRRKEWTKDTYEFIDFQDLKDCEWEVIKVKAIVQEWTKQVYLDNIAQVEKEIADKIPQKLIERRTEKLKLINDYEETHPLAVVWELIPAVE